MAWHADINDRLYTYILMSKKMCLPKKFLSINVQITNKMFIVFPFLMLRNYEYLVSVPVSCRCS